MPLITFKYTHSNSSGIPVIDTDVILPYRLPAGTRFTIKQVSVSQNESVSADMFKYALVYIPELMGSTNHVYFHNAHELSSVLTTSINELGLRFYMTQLFPQTIQAFPQLQLGRFFLQTNQLHLTVKGVGINGPVNITDFTIVLEYDTE